MGYHGILQYTTRLAKLYQERTGSTPRKCNPNAFRKAMVADKLFQSWGNVFKFLHGEIAFRSSNTFSTLMSITWALCASAAASHQSTLSRRIDWMKTGFRFKFAAMKRKSHEQSKQLSLYFHLACRSIFNGGKFVRVYDGLHVTLFTHMLPCVKLQISLKYTS